MSMIARRPANRHRRAARPGRSRASRSCRSPAPASPPNAAFRIFGRRAASGPRCGRSRSMNFWPARTCATKPGGAGSPWRSISAAPSPGRGHLALASLYRAGKIPGRRHAKHRQSAPSIRHRSGTCGRIARQQHLCLMPGLCSAVRIVVGEAEIYCGRGPRARLSGLAADISRPRRCRSDRRCPSEPCAARRNLRSAATFSSRSARRWWCGRRPDFP